MARTALASSLVLLASLVLTATPADAQIAFHGVGAAVDSFFPYDVDLADVNGDGALDMLIAHPDLDASLAVHLNDGSGGFDSGTDHALGDWADATDVGDLDGDGDLDLAVVSSHFTLQIATLLNDGAGQFTPGPVSALLTYGEDIALGDLDGDGHSDALVAIWGQSAMSVLQGDGTGAFTDELLIPLNGGHGFAVAAADLDGDGDLEAIATGYGDTSINSGRVYVFDNPGDGDFGLPDAYAVHKGAWALELADMDGDGDLDLLTTNRNADSVSLLRNDSTGSFGAQQTTSVGTYPADGQVADFDGDGDLDVVVPSYNRIHVLANDGAGGLSTALVIATNQAFTCGEAGDLDGDGQPDVLAGGGVEGLQRYDNVTNDPEPWVDLGFALAGVSGEPSLVGGGSLTAGSTATVDLSDAKPQAFAVLVIGYSPLGAPLKGGTLVPLPELLFSTNVDAAGELGFSLLWPVGVPGGTEVFLQYWIVDAAGPLGYAASNGVVGTMP